MLKILSIENKFPDIKSAGFSGNISLTDFDIVIVDPSHVAASFPESKVDGNNNRYIAGQHAHILLETIHRRRSEFSALLNKGRMVVTFLDALFDVRLISQGFSNAVQINNYSWLPDDNKKRFINRLVNGTGAGLKLVQKDHLFSSYFYAFQKELTFNAYVDTPSSFFDLGEVFIANSTDLAAGFSLRISNGLVVFLPRFKINEENNKKFLGILVSVAKKYFGSETITPPPNWVNAFEVPGIVNLNEKISEVDKEILELELQKKNIEKQRSDLNDYKFLLYEQGHALERKVLDSLRLMGFKAETVLGENTDFDVILESEEGRAIAEIEGKDDNAIHKDKIDQLLSAINQDGEQRDSFAKGILVGNHYRHKALDERDDPFTKTVMNLAKQYHYALIATIDLYNVAVYFLQHPEDEECKKTCRKAIFEADGSLVKFPIPEE